MAVEEWKTNTLDQIIGVKNNETWYDVDSPNPNKEEIVQGFKLLDKNSVLLQGERRDPFEQMAQLMTENEKTIISLLDDMDWTFKDKIMNALELTKGQQLAGLLAQITRKSKQVGFPNSIIDDSIDKSGEYIYRLRKGYGGIKKFA